MSESSEGSDRPKYSYSGKFGAPQATARAIETINEDVDEFVKRILGLKKERESVTGNKHANIG